VTGRLPAADGADAEEGTTLRVVVAEDHYLVRQGIRLALEETGAVTVVATVGSARDLDLVVAREHPDAVVTDIRMPPEHQTEGIEAAHRIRAAYPGVGVVVLSQYADATYAMDLLRDGTDGLAYLLKERVAEPAHLLSAVREVVEGGSAIDPAVVAAMVEHGRHRESSPMRSLTDRERDVLAQMAQGCSNAGIAEALHLSVSSVEKYSTSVFAKLGLADEPLVHRRVAAVLAFLHTQGRSTPL
jgi:DNA-binding NarL/FixJ family response regulator